MIHAWAIRLGLSNFDRDMLATGQSTFTGHGLAGVFMPSDGETAARTSAIPTRLFRTRAEARAMVPRLRNTWPRARVVQVIVDIREVGE